MARDLKSCLDAAVKAGEMRQETADGVMRDFDAELTRLKGKVPDADARLAALEAAKRQMAQRASDARMAAANALNAAAAKQPNSKARQDAIHELITAHGGRGSVQKIARQILAVKDTPAGLNGMVRQQAGGRAGKALYETFINGILSGPKTHVVNVTSNSLVALWSIPERYVAAGLTVMANSPDRITLAEANAHAFGLVHGLRDAVVMLARGNRAESRSDLQDQFEAFTKVEGQYGQAISATTLGLDESTAIGRAMDFIGFAINIPTTLLGKEDVFFKAVGYRMELNALAIRDGKAKGLEGEALAKHIADTRLNPPETLSAAAVDAAHYRTFTNRLGPQATKLSLALNSVEIAGFPALKLVVPFLRTPVNIMKYTLTRTPLAVASRAIRADIMAGGSRRAQALARIGTGSALMLVAANMVAEGLLVGAGPDDPELQKVWRDQGKQPYSIKIGDRWYAYGRLDPIGMLLGMAADTAETVIDADAGKGAETVVAGLVSISDNLLSKTYMQGVSDFIAALSSDVPQRNLVDWGLDQATAFMPYSAFLRNIAQASDPLMRDTAVRGREDNWKYFDEFRNRIKAQIPGLSQTLPPRRDVWGQPISRSSNLGWGFDFVSPMASRVDRPDAVDQAFLDNLVDIGRLSRSVQGVELTSEELAEYERIAGERSRQLAERVVASKGFGKMTSGPGSAQAIILEGLIRKAREAAKRELLAQEPGLMGRIVERKREDARTIRGQ